MKEVSLQILQKKIKVPFVLGGAVDRTQSIRFSREVP